jgi:hypothetical protein
MSRQRVNVKASLALTDISWDTDRSNFTPLPDFPQWKVRQNRADLPEFFRCWRYERFVPAGGCTISTDWGCDAVVAS